MSEANTTAGPGAGNTSGGWWYGTTENWNQIEADYDMEGANVTLAIVDLIIGMFGILANVLIFMFYLKKWKDLVPALYLVLSATDFVVSFTAILHFVAMILLVAVQEKTDSLLVFLAAVFVLTTLVLRVSVFVNVILVTVRTINITQPFYLINRTGLAGALIAFPLLILPVILYDTYAIYNLSSFWQSKIRYIFLPFVGEYCIQDLVVAVRDISAKKNVYISIPFYVTYLTSCAPFILAVIIALSCLGVVTRQLHARKTPGISVSKTGSSTEREVTVTITILTTIFSACTGIYTVYLTAVYIGDFNYWSDSTVLGWCYVTSTAFPFISSAANPVVLIARSASLRRFVRDKVVWWRREEEERGLVCGNPSVATTSVS